jgi:hypothetical protein
MKKLSKVIAISAGVSCVIIGIHLIQQQLAGNSNYTHTSGWGFPMVLLPPALLGGWFS